MHAPKARTKARTKAKTSRARDKVPAVVAGRATTTTNPKAIRAATFSLVPGMTIGKAARMLGVPAVEVSRARRLHRAEIQPSYSEIALAVLTEYGKTSSGKLGDLRGLADYIAYLDRSSTSPDEARAYLEYNVKSGILKITGDRWRLLKPWP
jgi:hypothetical protein